MLPLLRPGLEPASLHDTRLGQGLDTLFKANLNQIFSQVALRALAPYAVETPWIHQDTTTIALYGAYDEGAVDPRGPRPTYGHSKDGRGDLKRVLLSLGVDMTSDVKGCQPTFLGLHVFFPRCIGRAGASTMRRVILLLSVGWVPPSVRPSGACLTLGSRLLYQPPHAAEGSTTPGLRLLRCPLEPCRVERVYVIRAMENRLGLTRRWAPPWRWPTGIRSPHEQWPR